MNFSEQRHRLLFFLVPFSEELQSVELRHIEAQQVRSQFSQAFRGLSLSLLWLSWDRGFSYGPGVFQGLTEGQRKTGITQGLYTN